VKAVKLGDAERVDMQARLGDMQEQLDELLLSHDQQIARHYGTVGEREAICIRIKGR
jgi:hypothetical protein